MDVRVQDTAFNLGEELNSFAVRQSDMGALVSFTGIVRDIADGLEVMHIEHYPGMTDKAITKIAQEALKRWSLGDVLVIHRHGALQADDIIMMVATSAPHRVDAFEAAQFLMDYLKSRAPFWKKEISAAEAKWVASKGEDEEALTRWAKPD